MPLLLGLALFNPGSARAAGRVACAGDDATSAIQAALASGGTVQLSAGTCLISGTLAVGSDTVLRGAGIGRTVLRAATVPNFPIIQVGGDRQVTGASNVDLSGFSLDAGNPTSFGGKGTDGISVRWSSSHVSIHDLEVYAAGGNGIDVRGSDVTVSHDRVHDNEANGIYVIGKGHPGRNDAVPASRVQILDNDVASNSRGRRPEMKHGWDGIDIDPTTRDCLIQGNLVTGNDIILYENAKIVPYSSGHRIIGNTIQNVTQGGAGIDVAGPQANFQVTGNTIRTVIGNGIAVNGPVVHGVVRGNTISGASHSGIEVRDTGPTAHSGRPTDILLSDNSIAPTPGQAAILILHRARSVHITNNAVGAGGLGIVTQGAGPDLEMSGNH